MEKRVRMRTAEKPLTAWRGWVLGWLGGVAVFGLELRGGGLMVSELLYSPSAADGEERGEYMELWNGGEEALDVSGWRFDRGIEFVFPEGIVIGAGEYLVVAKDADYLADRYGLAQERVIGGYAGRLSNSGERVRLRDGDGLERIDFEYEVGGDWPAVAFGGAGHSLVFVGDLARELKDGRAWVGSRHPGGTPGRAKETGEALRERVLVGKGTYGRYFRGLAEPSGGSAEWASPGFVAGEDWLAGASGYGYSSERYTMERALVETQLEDMRGNYSSLYVRLWFELEAEELERLESLALWLVYDDGYVVYLNGVRVGSHGINGEPPAFDQFAVLSEDMADTIDLKDRQDLLVAGRNLLAIQGHNVRGTEIPLDDPYDFLLAPELTLGVKPEAGMHEALRGVVINEIQANHSLESDYVEFYNPTAQAIDMSGAWLSDEGSELGKHRLPAGTIVEAGGFLAVEVSGEKTGFGLSSGGEAVYLTAPDGSFAATAYGFGPQERDVGVGRHPDGGKDWHRSAEGTPGQANKKKRLHSPTVGISELMYHDAEGQGKEYLELYVAGNQAVDVSGWEFRGVRFRFEEGTMLEPGRHYVIADDEERLRERYDLPAESLLGEYGGSLSNEGDRVGLLDAWDMVVDSVRYGNEWPWPPTADGLGASLERRCWEAPSDEAGAWSGSPLGRPSPGRANSLMDCEEGEGSLVRLSEFVYHPALRSEDDRGTEFIELTNFGREAASLEGWALAGDVFIKFGAGVVLGSGDSVVAAWSPERLAQEYSQPGWEGVAGPYEGDLGNGGGEILLVRPDGSLADGVSYDDDFPWPSLADGRAAGEGGGDISLRRICWEGLGWDADNWAADRAPSPGRVEGGSSVGEEGACDSPVVLAGVETEPSRVTSEVEPLLTAVFAEGEGRLVRSAMVRYWVDDVEVDEGEAVMSLEMNDEGVDGDWRAGDGKWSVRMPLLAANSIVRYRVEWEETGGGRGVSPSWSRDAFAWHAYFVEPQSSSGHSNVYHLFLSAANWQRLEENIAFGLVVHNRANPRWNEEVAAVFVADGVVYDVQARHQGGNEGRQRNDAIRFECASHQSGRAPLRHWRVKFPSYRKHDGMDVLILKARTEASLRPYVSFRLFELAGVPAPRTGWAKLRINGCDYNDDAFQVERPGRDLIARWFGEVGDLFESQGIRANHNPDKGNEGPYFYGDGRLITGSLHSYTEQERYEYTYDRKTLLWKNHPFDGVADAPQAMIEGLHQARAQGREALRTWLAEHFDVDLTLRYLCATGYALSTADTVHNYYLYKKAGDGKWCLLPWDVKSALSPSKPGPDTSPFHHGDESRIGYVGNRWEEWNRFKDSFFIAYEAEYLEMLHQFNNTIYHPKRMLPMVLEGASRGGRSEDAARRVMDAFIYRRHDFLNCFIDSQCPPPLLTIRVEEGQILLEWPADQTDYTLETAVAIDYEAEENRYKVDWIKVPTTANRYLVPPNQPGAFFRLARNQESAPAP